MAIPPLTLPKLTGVRAYLDPTIQWRLTEFYAKDTTFTKLSWYVDKQEAVKNLLELGPGYLSDWYATNQPTIADIVAKKPSIDWLAEKQSYLSGMADWWGANKSRLGDYTSDAWYNSLKDTVSWHDNIKDIIGGLFKSPLTFQRDHWDMMYFKSTKSEPHTIVDTDKKGIRFWNTQDVRPMFIIWPNGNLWTEGNLILGELKLNRVNLDEIRIRAKYDFWIALRHFFTDCGYNPANPYEPFYDDINPPTNYGDYGPGAIGLRNWFNNLFHRIDQIRAELDLAKVVDLVVTLTLGVQSILDSLFFHDGDLWTWPGVIELHSQNRHIITKS